MMSHRFCLFYSGFTSYAPTLYFTQRALIGRIELELNDKQKIKLDSYSAQVSDSEEEYFSYIKTAASLAVYFDLDSQVKPETAEEYFAWLKEYTSAFERKFPMTRIDHYYFLYARKLSEIITNTRLAKTKIDLSMDFDHEFGFLSGAHKYIKDTEYILFKLIASAALLSSENRHGFFNTFYKEMNREFERFKRIDIEKMDTNALRALSQSLEEYQRLVMNGFKHCINLLKELGV